MSFGPGRATPPGHAVESDPLFATYVRYGSFGATGNPTFKSREFAKLVKDAGLSSARFNIRPPNRVDFVYAYACVHGPGGYTGNRSMSFEQFAYATKGIAHETGVDHGNVVSLLCKAEPSVSAATPPMPSPRSSPRSSARYCASPSAGAEWSVLQARSRPTPSAGEERRCSPQGTGCSVAAVSAAASPALRPWSASDSSDRRRLARLLDVDVQAYRAPEASAPVSPLVALVDLSRPHSCLSLSHRSPVAPPKLPSPRSSAAPTARRAPPSERADAPSPLLAFARQQRADALEMSRAMDEATGEAMGARSPLASSLPPPPAMPASIAQRIAAVHAGTPPAPPPPAPPMTSDRVAGRVDTRASEDAAQG